MMVSDSLFALGATFVTTCALSVVAQRFSPRYRKLPISAKTVLVLAPSMGAFYVRGEQVGTVYQRSKYMDQLNDEEREYLRKQREAMDSRRSLKERSIDFVADHRWSILGYTWLTGITGSLYHLYRKKGMTATQKAVQARMYAQAITIIAILSTAGIASLSGKVNDRHVRKNSAALEAALAGDTRINNAETAATKDKLQAASNSTAPSVIDKHT
ncbi:Replication factor C, subunit RFC4 [Coemansia spiralis]|uniref:Replication factor C, subunit RFC4 n=2 Tax=Coemansia TaxID=4863 RepID=A0A9W8FY13_9FUNG|nr:Replication factor C, subunit RFC4 [Coemansia umbellata]KAJ2619209.1 Replication factor C, subunit RFC4 [Coemansia sp. RSA 1358]KAJ2670562.1 Replication factor C, subunit RFC4 [Coemansia spiralis]